MGPEIYPEIPDDACQGGFCGASDNEEEEEDVAEEGRQCEISVQRDEVRCIDGSGECIIDYEVKAL